MGSIPNWKKSSGSFRIDEITTPDPVLKTIKKGTKVLTCVTAGSIAIPSKQAYGTWTGSIYKGADANDAFRVFIASKPVAWNNSAQNGYQLYFDNVEKIAIQKLTNGVASNLMVSAVSYLANNTWYDYKITRSLAGIFTLYLRGGSLVATAGADGWTLATVTTGSNPATDTSFTTSEYRVEQLGAGDRSTNIFQLDGIRQL